MKTDYYKLAYLGLFTALACILGYVESLIPISIGIPGIKLGLANLAVLYILIRYTWREAALVSVIRILVVGFLFGSAATIIYSLAGAALSLALMMLAHRKLDFSVIFVSIVGGVSHNIGQLLIAIYVAQTAALIYYAPVLLIAGIITGLLVGIVTQETLKRVRF